LAKSSADIPSFYSLRFYALPARDSQAGPPREFRPQPGRARTPDAEARHGKESIDSGCLLASI
jgi:hypothetical protein